MESFSVLRSIPREDTEEIAVVVVQRTKAFDFLCLLDVTFDRVSLGFAFRLG